MLGVIDTHTFYGRNPINEEIYTLSQFRGIQREYLGKYSIRFIVIPASPEGNKEIADVVEQNPDVFLGAFLQVVPRKGLLFPYTPPDRIRELTGRKEIVGLKVITSLLETPLDSELLEPYVKVAEVKGLPILYHCSGSGDDYSSALQKRNLLERHPSLTVIFAHLGGLHPKDISETIAMLARHPNLYINTTSISGEERRIVKPDGKYYIPQGKMNPALRESLGQELASALQYPEIPRRILFGTDYPFLRYDFFPFDHFEDRLLFQTTVNAKRLLHEVAEKRKKSEEQAT